MNTIYIITYFIVAIALSIALFFFYDYAENRGYVNGFQSCMKYGNENWMKGFVDGKSVYEKKQ